MKAWLQTDVSKCLQLLLSLGGSMIEKIYYEPYWLPLNLERGVCARLVDEAEVNSLTTGKPLWPEPRSSELCSKFSVISELKWL